MRSQWQSAAGGLLNMRNGLDWIELDGLGSRGSVIAGEIANLYESTLTHLYLSSSSLAPFSSRHVPSTELVSISNSQGLQKT